MTANLDVEIFEMVNGDLLFLNSSEDPTFETLRKIRGANAGDFFLISEDLINYDSYTMFSVNDYSILQTGLLENRGSSYNEPPDNQINDLFSVKIAIDIDDSEQPASFILRIFNDTNVFRGPFSLRAGNTGLIFRDTINPLIDHIFTLSSNYSYEPSVTLVPAVQSNNNVKFLGYLFIVFIIVYFIKYGFKNPLVCE